jgi:beta-glucosidase
LQDRYRGWESREVVNDFADYATQVAKRLGDRVTQWMTLNEILTFAMVGYGVKASAPHAPGLSLGRPKDRWQVVHHALLAHGRACQAIRAASPGPCSVAIAENFSPFVPVIETPEHIEAVRLAFTRTEANGAIITPLLTGTYDPFWLAQQGAEAPEIRAGDMETIHQKLDGLGFNCYTGTYVRAASTPAGFELLPMFDGYPKMALPWLNFVPESIYWGIRMIKDALGQGQLPIFITENGCADAGPTDGGAEVQDIDRVMYLRSYLRQVQRAVDEGYTVVGYFPWSLMDNFEWAEGYAKRFGLVYVDYATQRRTPKLSYRWFQQVIRGGTVV